MELLLDSEAFRLLRNCILLLPRQMPMKCCRFVLLMIWLPKFGNPVLRLVIKLVKAVLLVAMIPLLLAQACRTAGTRIRTVTSIRAWSWRL